MRNEQRTFDQVDVCLNARKAEFQRAEEWASVLVVVVRVRSGEC